VPSTATTAAKVRVSDAASTATSDTSDAAFTITVSGPGTDPSAPITAESEANDTPATADSRVAAGTNVSGGISTSTDVDWFKFNVTAPGTVTVKLSMPGTGDLDWYLYSASDLNLFVTRGYTTANPELASANLAAGEYYVKVVGYAGATSNYTLNVSGTGVQP
jgi:hypothetical protein